MSLLNVFSVYSSSDSSDASSAHWHHLRWAAAVNHTRLVSEPNQ